MAIDILAAMQNKPEPLNFVLPGLVRGTVGAIVSPGGAGKSAFALQLTAQVAGGPDLMGLSVLGGKSVYLPGEDPEAVLCHRLFALGEKCNSEQREAISKRLFVEPMEKSQVNIMHPEWFEYLREAATGQTLLVLDTLRTIHLLDENDAGAMTAVIGRMKEIAATTGCSIIFLHHTSKSSALNGQAAEQQASRGSSVLVDNIRWQGYLKTMSETEAEDFGVQPERRKYFVQFGVSKQNYGAPFESIWLQKVSSKTDGIEGGYTLQKAVLEKKNASKSREKDCVFSS